MAKPVQLDSFAWTTQSAALNAFRAILRTSGYGVGDRISDPVHDLMLREVLERHPDVDEKVGAGVDHFFIGRTQDASGTPSASGSTVSTGRPSTSATRLR